MGYRTTSIKIDPALWKRVKIHCLDNDVYVQSYVARVLRDALDEAENPR